MMILVMEEMAVVNNMNHLIKQNKALARKVAFMNFLPGIVNVKLSFYYKAFLLSLCVLFSLPVFAIGGITFSEQFDPTQEIEDMRVKVLGGYVRITRQWDLNSRRWVFNKRWNNIQRLTVLAYKRSNEIYDYTHTIDGRMVFEDGAGNQILRAAWAPAPTDETIDSSEVIWRGRDGSKIYYRSSNSNNFVNSPFINSGNIELTINYKDKNDIAVNFERDSDNFITEIKDHHGNVVISYEWSAKSQSGSRYLLSVTDYMGRKVQYDYGTDGNLKSVTDILGEVWQYKYTDNSLAEQLDPLGRVTKFSFVDQFEITNPDAARMVRTAEKDIKDGKWTGLIKTTEIKPSNSVVETWSNSEGELVKEVIDGQLHRVIEYVKSNVEDGHRHPFYYNEDGREGEITHGDLYCKLIGAPSVTITMSCGVNGFGFGFCTHWTKCATDWIDTYKRDVFSIGGNIGGADAAIRDFKINELKKKNISDPIIPHSPDALNPLSYIKTKIVTDARGNKTTHEYDQWKNEIKVTYPDETSISRTWHSKYAFPLTETNEKGIVTAYEYDQKGNLLALIEAKGTDDQRITRYTYDQYGQLKTITTGESAANNTALATTHYDYDQYGNVTQITDPEGNVTRYSDYDVLGNARTITDARANILPTNNQYTWKTTYDAVGNLLTNRSPYDQGETYTYNKVGDLETITSASGSKVTLVTDSNGQPVTMTDDNGKVTAIEYNKAGQLTKTTDANGNKTQTLYDSQGRLTRTIDGENNNTQFTYVENQLRSIQYPSYKELLEYDDHGRVKQSTQQANNRNYLRKRGYDLQGNVTSATDAQEKNTVYEYDALNRIKKIIDASNAATEFTYDARNNLLQVKDPEGRLTLFTYDKNDFLLSETKDGDQNTPKQRRYSYDQNGNLISSINPEQEKTLYKFDQANRLIETSVYAHKDHAHPIKVISYNIDEKNHLAGWSQGVSNTLPEDVIPTADVIPLSETYTYNNLEQLESVTVNFGSFSKTYSYTYYPNSLKKTYTNPEGVVYTYFYNKNNQLTAVHIPGEGQISWANFDWMMPQTILLPGGQKIALKYDDFQQLTERSLKKANGQTIASAVYEHDLEKNIKKITKSEGVFNYSYDDRYRLVNADSPEGYAANDETFAYDGVGNRTLYTQGTGDTSQSETLSYNLKNQLINTTASTVYSYNANGHTKTQSKNGITTEYIYNHEERLIAVKRNNMVIAEYAYNVHGQRVKKTANGNVTWYLYNENGLSAEYNSAGNLVKEYHFHPQKTWMTDPLFMRTAANDVYYYHNDHLGTPQQVIDAAGQVLWQAQFSAFGKAHISVESIENNLRFPGQYFDVETGLHQNYFRDYDAETGRYVQEDPLGMASSMNYYAYAYQNPLSYTDPTGEIVPVVAAYLRCVLQCMAMDAAANAVFPNPCYTPEQSAKNCAADCANPINWIGGGKPPKMNASSGGSRPPNMSPPGAGRPGAFNEAKRQSGVPTSQSPDRVIPNVDKRGNPQPGSIYEFDIPKPGGGKQTVQIRDDAGGHKFPDDSSQDRGPHFNDPEGNHYDYPSNGKPNGNGSNLNQPSAGSRPGGIPGGRPSGKPGGGCDC